MDSPFKVVYGMFVILVIVYSAMIPVSLREFADSLLGRIIGILWIYGALEGMGWVYGLITAVAFLLLLYRSPSSPYTGSTEGFDGGGTISEKRRIGKRWFVERVLGEHPVKISTDRVTTLPVQD